MPAAEPLLELLFLGWFVILFWFTFDFFHSAPTSEAGVNLRSGTDPERAEVADSLCSCPHAAQPAVLLPFRIVFWIFRTRFQDTNLLRNRLCRIFIPFYSEGCKRNAELRTCSRRSVLFSLARQCGELWSQQRAGRENTSVPFRTKFWLPILGVLPDKHACEGCLSAPAWTEFGNKYRYSFQSTCFVKTGPICLSLMGHVHCAHIFLRPRVHTG